MCYAFINSVFHLQDKYNYLQQEQHVPESTVTNAFQRNIKTESSTELT